MSSDRLIAANSSASDHHSQVREADPIGHRVHVALAMAYLLMLPLITSAEGITFGILLAFAALRLPKTRPCYRALRRDRVMWLFLVTAVILGISILWSEDRMEGLTELKAFRVIALPWALWPIIGEAPWLIGAFLAGVFGLDLVQSAQHLNLFGLELKGEGRARGTLHPIQSGAVNLATLTWYLPAMLRIRLRRGRKALILPAALVAGAFFAMIGLVLSGSRGVWIAAAVMLPIEFAYFCFSSAHGRRNALILLAPVALAVVVVVTTGGDRYIAERIEDARENLRRADEGDYTTSVGMRVVMARWAWQMFKESPVYGHGAGSFRALSKGTSEFAEMQARWPNRAAEDKFTPAHPHNAYLHMMVATGIVGTIPFLCLLAVVFGRLWRDASDHVFARAGPFVLLGWMIGTLSDCFTLNGHLFGLFGFLAALALARRRVDEALRIECADQSP